MEFSRRGPATDDPPPHGEAMLVMRDALLWQLQKDHLRQEIIMAELAKIERAMALGAASGHHSMPMPRDSMPQHKGPVFGWEHYADVGEENDVKLPSNYGRQSAEPRSWNPIAEDRAEKCCSPCKCRVDPGEHNSAFDEQKPRDSSENVPPNKASPAEKWELTGITIPVKKPKPPMSPRKRKKPPMRWSCPGCQVQADCAQDVHKHCAGKKHRSNIARLESGIKALGGQKAKKAAEPSLGTYQMKTSLIRWSCSTCQANGTCQSDLEEHLKGTWHQHNINALCKGGNNDIVENISLHEAKSRESNVPQHAEKPPLAGCNICQVICGRESDLEIHLKGKRHLKKIQALFEESNTKAINSESLKANLNLDSGPLHVEKMNCDLDLENHVRDERRTLNARTLCETINQEENSPPEISKEQTPSLEWDCTMCQAKCASKAHFENHCISRKHQQRTQVILSECDITKTGRTHAVLSEGDITKMGNIHMEASCKEGSNNDMEKNVVSQEAKSHESNVPEHAEKPPSVQSCNICQGICNCAPDFDMPQHVEETSCKLSWESYLRPRDESLQLMDDWALREKINQDKSNPPEMSKDQISSSEWDCATCQAKCNSDPQTEHHCKNGKHQQKIDVTLHEGDIAEVSSLNAALCKEDNNSHMDVAAWEAKSDECIVSQHVEKPPSVWSCSDCQVICARESDFEVHLKRERHLMKIGALLEESKNMAISESQKANLYPDSVPQHAEKMNCELDLGNNHGDERHQLNVCSPCKENNQMKKNPPEIANDQEPPSEWDCAMCREKCNSESQIEHHCESRRNQQKTDVILREGDIAIVNSLHIVSSCKEGDNNSTGITPQEAKSDENNVQQHAEKPPPVWDCSVCQVTCNRESDLVFHLNSKRHLKKFRALLEGSNNKAMNSDSQTANLNQDSVPQHAEKTNCELNWESYHRLGDKKHQLNVQALGEAINQDKNSPAEKDQMLSLEWDCAMCQAKCNSKVQLEHHCTGRKHQQKTQAVLGEGDIAEISSSNDMAKNVVSRDAKSRERNVPQHVEKPPLVGCSICQVICGRESDLEIHLKAKRHLKKIRALFEESQKAINSESLKANLNRDSGPLQVGKMDCDLDSENHLRDERHQLNVRTLCETINQEENSPPEISKDQTPSSEWDCAACQAKCISRAHFENQCISRKHQQRTQVMLSEGDIAIVNSLHMGASCKGSNNVSQDAKSHESNAPEHESPPIKSCSICQGICNCESDLDIHLMSKRIQVVTEECKNTAMSSELQKAKLNSSDVPQHVEETSCQLNWESYSRRGDESLQLVDDQALCEKINQDKNNPPEIAKDQIPSSEWDCATCQAKCNSKAQFENHCMSRKHQRKVQVMLARGDLS
ncbi:hypothetical protein CFC21_065977 [Triticum aestivum]|uniref:C2H2-type domain-containing protein n=3 Tax=Triticum aestivum TaxID=4565 RepID=A0A9R1H543_WHEAT|nr:hypothetical protein CFC21_065977 [Triticum aestivum]